MSHPTSNLLIASLLIACSLAAGSPALAQPQPKKQEELRHVVARRIRQATGVKVRIGGLTYNVFNSTFVGKKISAGPPNKPVLRLGGIKLKMELLADRPGTTVANLEATGMQARVGVKYLGRSLMSTHKMVTVRRGSISGPRVAVVGPRGPQIVAKSVHLFVTNLVVPVIRRGSNPQLSGEVRLTVRSLEIGGQVLTGLALTGKLKGASVVIKKATVTFMNGPVIISGRIGLDGAVDLIADVTLLPWGARGPTIEGKVRIKGVHPQRLTLSGNLKTGKKLKRRRGRARSAPSIKLRVRVGRSRLGGTLKRWRIR